MTTSLLQVVSDMLRLSHHLQIFRGIIALIPINVMYDLTRQKRATEDPFSNETMLMLTTSLPVSFSFPSVSENFRSLVDVLGSIKQIPIDLCDPLTRSSSSVLIEG